MSEGAVGLPDDLVTWMEEVGGGRVALAERMPGGGRKEAWFIDLEGGGGTVTSLFLRYDRSDDAEEPLRVYADPAGHPFCIFVATS